MWPPAKIMTIRDAPMAIGANGPAPLSMTVQPMVSTRKKVPMSSTRYLFIFVSRSGEGRHERVKSCGEHAPAEGQFNRACCRRGRSPLVNPGPTLCEASGARLVIFAGKNGRGERCAIERPPGAGRPLLPRTARGGDQIPGWQNQRPVEDPQSLVSPREDHQHGDGNGEQGGPGQREMRASKSVANAEDRRQHKEEGRESRQRLTMERNQAKGAGQRTECHAHPKGSPRGRADDVAAGPGPGHKQEEMAEQQHKAFVARRPGRTESVVEEPFIGCGHRDGNMHKQVGAGKRHTESREPWLRVLPKESLATEHQTENVQ